MSMDYQLWDIYTVILWGSTFRHCSFCHFFPPTAPRGPKFKFHKVQGRKKTAKHLPRRFWFHESLVSFPAFHQHRRKSQPRPGLHLTEGQPTSPPLHPLPRPSPAAHGSLHKRLSSICSSLPLGFTVRCVFH